MVNFLEPDGGQDLIEFLGQVMRLVARQERASIFGAFNKGVNRVSVGFDGREDHSSMLIRQLVGSSDRHAAVGDGVLVDGSGVLNSEGDIFDSISMLNQMFVHLLRGIPMIDRAEDKSSPLVIPDHMTGDSPVSSLKPLIGEIIKAKPGGIVGGSLFGISNPEGDMVQLENAVPKARILPKDGSVDCMICQINNISLYLITICDQVDYCSLVILKILMMGQQLVYNL